MYLAEVEFPLGTPDTVMVGADVVAIEGAVSTVPLTRCGVVCVVVPPKDVVDCCDGTSGGEGNLPRRVNRLMDVFLGLDIEGGLLLSGPLLQIVCLYLHRYSIATVIITETTAVTRTVTATDIPKAAGK